MACASADPGSPSAVRPPSFGAEGAREAAVAPVRGHAFIYATFAIGENPLSQRNGQPQGAVTVALGQGVAGQFTPAVRFGLANDGRAGQGMLQLTPWVTDGALDYYGPFARPHTPCDCKLALDLAGGRMTVWVSIRGDDRWFLLAEDVPLVNPVAAIDTVQVEVQAGAGGVDSLVVAAEPWSEGERLRPHPSAERDRHVATGAGYRYQSMRSLWRQPGRSVTISRQPPVWMGFPDPVQTGPNTLVCIYADGTRHGAGGKLLVRHSADLGHTWGAPQILHTGPINCPRLQRLADGTLLALADLHNARYDVLQFRSADGGHTWQALPTLNPVGAGGHSGCVPSRVTELPDGAWLLSTSWYQGDNAWEGDRGELLEFYRSTDRGQTWAYLSALDAYPPHCLCEASILVMPDGRLLLYAREDRCDGLPGVKAWSQDGGRTWTVAELPFAITGRTCAGFLPDGRVLLTFRSQIGRPALWAWVGWPDDATGYRPAGIHQNDAHSVALKDGALHIDNDGACGQFTQYILRPADTPATRIDVTAELQVAQNAGLAATLSIPFAGRLRFFPDRVALAHDPALCAAVAPGVFHTYRAISEHGQLTLLVDGAQVLRTDRLDGRIERPAWTPSLVSPLVFSFGNEPVGGETPSLGTTLYSWQIAPAVTGYSLWRRVDARLSDPLTGEHEMCWSAATGEFPDQYQLEHIIEVEASVTGRDQGYSGWIRLEDGRILVAAYTDDTAPTCPPTGNPAMGVAWIRGTFLLPEDLPPRKARDEAPQPAGAL